MVTHGMFKFTKNNSSKDGRTWWYTCARKAVNGCSARAIIERMESVDENGVTSVQNKLVDVATPETHARFHAPDNAAIIADKVMMEMKKEIEKDLTIPVGEFKDSITRNQI